MATAAEILAQIRALVTEQETGTEGPAELAPFTRPEPGELPPEFDPDDRYNVERAIQLSRFGINWQGSNTHGPKPLGIFGAQEALTFEEAWAEVELMKMVPSLELWAATKWHEDGPEFAAFSRLSALVNAGHYPTVAAFLEAQQHVSQPGIG